MAINRTGVFTEDAVTGLYRYGNGGVGSLTVNGGSLFNMTASDPALEPFLLVGANAGGNGSLTITGANSRVRVIGDGDPDHGAGGIIGRDGGTGSMTITAGGRFDIIDNSTAPVAADYSNSEFFNIGRNAGSNGTLTVNAGTFSIVGGASAFQVGRDGGTGTASFSSGSVFSVQSITSGSIDGVFMAVGRGVDGDGTLSFDASTGSLTGHANSDAGFHVGRDGGTGLFELLNNSTFTITGGVQGSFTSIGRGDGGVGTMTVNDSEFSVSSDANSAMSVGFAGGDGTLEMLAGSLVHIQGSGAYIDLGQGPMSDGTVTVNNSMIELMGGATGAGFNVAMGGADGVATFANNAALTATSNEYAGMIIGRDGGLGTVNFQSGSDISFDGAVGSYVTVGRNADSTGTLNVNNATLAMVGGNDGAGLQIGREGAVGFGNFSNNAVVTLESAAFTGMQIGRDGGTGTANVSSGASLSFQGALGSALQVGRNPGSDGTLNINNASISIDGGGDSAGFTLGGAFGTGGGVGEANLDNNASITVATDIYANFNIAQSGGGGILTMESGSTIEIISRTMDGNSWGIIGGYGGTGIVEINDATLRFQSTTDAGLHIGTEYVHDANDAGDGSLLVENDGLIEFVTPNGASLMLGGGTGSSGAVTIRSGSRIDLDSGGANDGIVRIGGYQDGAVGSLTVDGAGSSVTGFSYAVVGHDTFDTNVTAAGQGNLTISNGGTLSGDFLVIGDDGTLFARGGTVDSTIAVRSGSIDARGGAFGVTTVTGDVYFEDTGNTVFLEVGASNNDRINVAGSTTIGGNLSLTITPVAGYKFVSGETRTFFTLSGGVNGEADITIAGQHADFGYYAGYLAASPADFVVQALTGGTSGGHAVLDFGAASPTGAMLEYNASIARGEAWGGRFSADGGVVANIDEILGTNQGDDLRILVPGDGSRSFVIDGRGGNDILLGGAGADNINGGAGNDIMNGAGGNDIFHVDSGSDGVIEGAGGGIDRIYTSVSYALAGAAQVEIMTTNNAASTTALNLTGNSFNQSMAGNNGANVINGGGGADGMNGLGGNDTFYVDDLGDVITEVAGGGVDRVYTYVSYALGAAAQVEVLTTTNEAGLASINLYGNNFSQVIAGNNGSNILNGGGGIDQMQGKGGNDFFYVDNIDDIVVEGSGGGIDRVYTTVSYALDAAAQVEVMSTTLASDTSALNLYGNNHSQAIAGNNGVNIINGGGGIDSMRGFDGNDFYYVDNLGDLVIEGTGGGIDRVYSSGTYALDAAAQVEILTTTLAAGTSAVNFYGNSFSQAIAGNGGDNIINGGGNADGMNGLGGNDTFYVDHVNDLIIEAGGGGTDRVLTSVNYALSATAEVEIFTTTNAAGTDAINLYGNGFAQSIAGNNGNNLINGGGGADTMNGLGGNDQFYVDNAGDMIIEAGGGGTDRVLTSVSYALGASAEVEVFTTTNAAGSNALNLTGNGFGQTIAGNNGVNIIDGGGGNDTLQGLGGADIFVFGPSGGADTISDFEDDIDTLDFSAFNFADASEALSFASDTGSDVLFDFSPGNTLLLSGVANISDLNNDIMVA